MFDTSIHTSAFMPEGTIALGYPPRLILEEWDNPDIPKPIEITGEKIEDAIKYTCTIRGRLEKRT